MISCTNKEMEAHKLIINYLNDSNKEWTETEIINFSIIDSSFSRVEDNHEYKRLSSLASDLDWKLFNAAYMQESKSKGFNDERQRLQEHFFHIKLNTTKYQVNKYHKKSCAIRDNFIPEFNGWQMSIKCKTTYRYGYQSIDSYIFYFDKEMKKIKRSMESFN